MLSVMAICIGASVGALARWGLGLWLSPGAVLPWGTLAANLVGGYLVGVCVAVFQALPQLDPVWRLLLVTGFLGALTTFSSFSAEVVGIKKSYPATASYRMLHDAKHASATLRATLRSHSACHRKPYALLRSS